MYGTKELRDDLRKKLGVGERQLRRLIAARAAELPSTHEEALFVLAHESNLTLRRYLTPEQIAGVRALVQGGPPTARTPQVNGERVRRTAIKPRPTVVTIAGINVEKLPGMTAAHARQAKMMAEKVYPMVYVFENSVRDVVERVLKQEFGSDWWTEAVPGKVQATAKSHKDAEKKDAWHSQRGGRDIDYVFLNDLWAIIKHQWLHFRALFPSQPWAETLITSDMNVSRRVLAHMTPLDGDDVKNLEAAFRKWAKQLKGVEDKLP
jgi:Swt1-like HEPN